MGFFSLFKRIWNAPPKHQYKKRSYAGAAKGRLHGDWQAYGTSGNAENQGSIQTLRNRVRSLVRDNDYVKGLKREFINNTVYLGIDFQAQVRTVKTQVNQDNINDQIEAAWKSWCKAKYCDVSTRQTFQQMQRLIAGSYFESGEVFIRIIKQSFNGSPVPLALEVIEADQVADDYNATHNENRIVMGVELNQWQQPVAYWIYENHPGDYHYGSTGLGGRNNRTANSRHLTRIPATEIIHYYNKDRPGVVRGVPLLHSSINRLRHLDKYEEAELVACRAAANYMGIITSEQEDFSEPDTDDDGNYLGGEKPNTEESLKPGIIKRLAHGEEFNSFTPNRPNAAFAEFYRSNLRAIAAAVGISYQRISHDSSQSNYSSSRLDMLLERDTWKVFQQDFIAQVLQPIYEIWLEQAVLAGVLRFSDYALRPERYQNVRWQTRGWGWVDPQKEQQATIQALASGTQTYTAVFAEQGRDFTEEIKVMEKERKLLEAAGINPIMLNQQLFPEPEGNSGAVDNAANS